MHLGLFFGYSGARISIDMELVRDAAVPEEPVDMRPGRTRGTHSRSLAAWKQSPVNPLLVATAQIEAVRWLTEVCN